MRLSRRRGFTLLEILTAVMLTGILTGLALAPVVMTVRRVVEIQDTHSGSVALSRTFEFIARDLNAALRLAQSAIIVKDHEAFGGYADDTLAVMTATLARQQIAAGTVVYKIERESELREAPAGLYRWIFPGKQPREVDTDKLRSETGQLVLPGVTAFNVEVPRGTETLKQYSGAVPVGIYISLSRGGNEKANQGNNEKGSEESFEDVVIFPN